MNFTSTISPADNELNVVFKPVEWIGKTKTTLLTVPLYVMFFHREFLTSPLPTGENENLGL